MSEFNFEQLKDINFKIPESWIEDALEVPPEKKKPAGAMIFYRHAIGAAACVILAAAVTFSLMFGIGKDVNMVNPNGDDVYHIEDSTGKTSATDSNGNPIPEDDLPMIFGGDNENSTLVTEPAETDANGNVTSSKTKQKSTSPSSGRNAKTKRNSPAGSNSASSDTGYIEPGEDETPGENIGETTAVAKEPYEEPLYEESTVMPTTVEPCLDPDYVFTTSDPYAARTYEYSAVVFNGKAKGDVYFKLTDQNGTVIANGLVTNKTPYEGKTRISYSVFMKPKVGNTYTWVFYDSNGTVIKQGSFYIR